MKVNTWDFAAAGSAIGTIINLWKFVETRTDETAAGIFLGCAMVLIFNRLAGAAEKRQRENDQS